MAEQARRLSCEATSTRSLGCSVRFQRGDADWHYGVRAERRGDAARPPESLVPPGSRIVAREDGDCVMFADSPRATGLAFSGLPSTWEASGAVRKAAGQAGWELEEELRAEGGTFLDFRRDGLKASVTLWADVRANRCRLRPRMDCADHVRIVR